jgi:hypothetical protein
MVGILRAVLNPTPGIEVRTPEKGVGLQAFLEVGG